MTDRPKRMTKVSKLRASLMDRLLLRMCKSRSIDGLWIGTLKDAKAEYILRRVEQALNLIKCYDPLQYARVIHNLDRVWVHLLPAGQACFRASLQACILDERYVLSAATTPEMLAKTIVHEATHARLDQLGFEYDEKQRARIEAVCFRRERAFTAKLPQAEALQEEVARKIDWFARNGDYFSNESFHQRDKQGKIEALRYLGAPEWTIRAVFRFAAIVAKIRRLSCKPNASVDRVINRLDA